jgi:hypothetical protein
MSQQQPVKQKKKFEKTDSETKKRKSFIQSQNKNLSF